MLIPFWQTPWPQAGFGVHTAEKPTSMLASIAAALHSVDPSVALAQPKTLDKVRDDTMADERFTLILFSSFAAVALFLAALGIYGVMSFSVANRAHEIALRMALGATPNRVIGLVVRDGVLLVAVGLLLGLIGAYFVGRACKVCCSACCRGLLRFRICGGDPARDRRPSVFSAGAAYHRSSRKAVTPVRGCPKRGMV